jgi:transposase
MRRLPSVTLAQNHRLQHLLHQLQRMQFGRRSEKLDPDQLHLLNREINREFRAYAAN